MRFLSSWWRSTEAHSWTSPFSISEAEPGAELGSPKPQKDCEVTEVSPGLQPLPIPGVACGPTALASPEGSLEMKTLRPRPSESEPEFCQGSPGEKGWCTGTWDLFARGPGMKQGLGTKQRPPGSRPTQSTVSPLGPLGPVLVKDAGA